MPPTHTGSLWCLKDGTVLVVTATGTGDSFNDTGGYGFISTEGDVDDEDVFFHMVDVGGPGLEEGQEAEFDIESSPRDPARRTSSTDTLIACSTNASQPSTG